MKIFNITCLIILIGIFSCEISDTNIDPTRPSDATLDLMLPELITQTSYNQTTNPARAIGIVLQQFEGLDAQQLQYNDYIINTQAFNNYWRFGLYAGSGRTANLIIDKANDEGATHYAGIAKLMMANSLFEASSMFGDIPYSEAFQGSDNLQPAFDTQESLIAEVFALIDDAMLDFQSDAGSLAPGGDDLLFGGNIDSWIAYGNALRARVFMQSTEVDQGAAQKALDALQNAFQSSASQAEFVWDNSLQAGNPYAKFENDRAGTLNKFNSKFEDFLGEEDPRVAAYSSGNRWFALNSTIPLISYAELKFIEAEALYRTGASSSDVQAALEAAITESLVMNNIDVENAADFINSSSDITDLSGEQILEKIINEAYKAYYCVAFNQAWNNFRRTGYPQLTPIEGGVNGNNPSGVVPLRWLYADSEFTTNSANVQAAIDRQGGHLLDDGLWLFGGN